MRREADTAHVNLATALRWGDAAEQGAATSHTSLRRRPKLDLASCRRADGAVVTYDAGGNKTSESHTYGDPGAADDVLAKIQYANCADNHILSKPNAIEVYGNGALMRHRTAQIADSGPCRHPIPEHAGLVM